MEEAAMSTVKPEESSLDSVKEQEKSNEEEEEESAFLLQVQAPEVDEYQWSSTYDSENHMEPFVSIIELEGGVIHPLEIGCEKGVKRSPRKKQKGKVYPEVVAGCSQASVGNQLAHIPVKLDKRLRCHVCRITHKKRRQSFFACSSCTDAKNNKFGPCMPACFNEWHEKNK